jgi:hypothetical protein
MAELAARRAALARGVRLEALTVGWMAIEAAVTIGAGVARFTHRPVRRAVAST